MERRNFLTLTGMCAAGLVAPALAWPYRKYFFLHGSEPVAGNLRLPINLRIVRRYDIGADRFPMRIDVLSGWDNLMPDLREPDVLVVED